MLDYEYMAAPKKKVVVVRKNIIKTDPLIALIFLFLLVVAVILGFKLLKYRMALGSTAVSLSNQSQSAAVDTANLVAATVLQNGMYKQPKATQAYVTTASTQTKRNIVVVDKNKKIIADTIAVNMTSSFQEDKNGEVSETIRDGQVRTFVESSKNYPHGITQVVVPLTDGKTTVGAVIVSVDQL